MPQNWKTYKLGEVLKVKHGYAFKGKHFTTDPNDNLLLTPGNFEPRGGIKFNWDKQKFYSGEFPEEYICSKGDLLVAMTDLTQSCIILGSPVLIKDNKYSYLHNQRLGLIQEDQSLIDRLFLYYYFNSYPYRQRLIATKSGSTVSHTAPERIYDCDIYLPPLPEQKAIASILSAIDDKIENNLAMNKTLEEMAMALYKHWFVDFGPFQHQEFIDSELGSVPKGWEVKPIGDVIETVGGGTPKTTVAEYWDEGDINWYSPTDLTKSNALYSDGSAKRITKLGLDKSSARLFPPGSLMMSSRATIGALAINRHESCTNQGFITMIPNEQISVYQLHGWAVHNMALIISKANGSTFKEISKANFRSLPILIGEVCNVYAKEVQGFYLTIENNLLEIDSLTQLRDTLLPKLISGEVRVKDAEHTVANAL